MKNLILSFKARWLALPIIAILCSTQVWAETVTGTIYFRNDDTKINAASVTGDDSRGNTWTVTTAGTSSYTPGTNYCQVGSSTSPATSITFTATLPKSRTISAFSIKLGGFSGTAGSVTLKVGNTSVGTGSLSTTSDVTISASNTTTSGTELTITITSISKGVKVYYISYSYNATPYTVTWMNDGEQYTTTTVYDGEKPTCPSNPSSFDATSDDFYGWSTAEWSGSINSLEGKFVYRTGRDMPAVDAAVTYYAVWGDKSYGDESSITGGECTTDYPPQGTSGNWPSTGGTGNYFSSSHGVKFDGVGDYIQSEDISSGSYTSVSVKIKAGHNGGEGSILAIATLDASGNVIASGTITPTETYTSITKTYTTDLEGSSVIKYVRVTMTTKVNNLGMELCQVYNKPVEWSKYITNSCDALGSISESVTLTKTAFTITATWPTTSGGHETGYKVQLYDNNGTGVKGSPIGDPVEITGTAAANRTCTFGAKTPVGNRLTHNHEYFVGVTPTNDEGGDYCEEGTEVTASTTTNQAYTVTYAAGTGGSGTMTDTNSPYETGDEVTVLANTFYKNGSSFNGWTYSPAQSVTDDKFTMGSANVTITATWVTNTDHFKDYMHGNTISNKSGNYGTMPTALSDEDPGSGCTGEHYKFMGWIEESGLGIDGKPNGTKPIIPAGESGHYATNTTYYAVWAAENE